MASRILRWLLTALGLGYVASPVDLLPDLIPGVGQVDDMAVIVALAAYWIVHWMRRKKTASPSPPLPRPPAR